ncbi:hypothetical protein ACF3DV_17700 [Chlorogloeopsis fritschii PCC 9212]|uniref:hypothetical protein n=1 Tax=Chlorogloeopsis fritschii TaxID=1124 RepID=UPI0008FBFA1B|nr:hypothetical protein [Chlorogloeopsis fritschii]MBF2005854.1 hypothetical protein [Chlorogloeopsis fritschii C42_A2020_084]
MTQRTPRPPILKPNETYTFRSYFLMKFAPADILKELGANLVKGAINLLSSLLAGGNSGFDAVSSSHRFRSLDADFSGDFDAGLERAIATINRYEVCVQSPHNH